MDVDYTELSNHIKETLIANDDLEPDQASPITIELTSPVLNGLYQ